MRGPAVTSIDLHTQRSMLPHAQSVVVVLLKLLLATVTSNPASQAPPAAGSPTTLEPPGEVAVRCSAYV
jgi:hypothetical protein